MEPVQFYETTVADRTQSYSFRFLAIPQRSLAAKITGQNPPAKDALANVIHLEQLTPVRAASLPQILIGMLRIDESENAQAVAVFKQFIQPELPDSDLVQFAEYLAFTNLIPIEESPISLVSLASKAAGFATSPVALGAFIGVIAGGLTPLLLLTVPTGIIVCATAKAFADVIDKHRDAIMSELLGLPIKNAQKVSAPQSSPIPSAQVADADNSATYDTDTSSQIENTSQHPAQAPTPRNKKRRPEVITKSDTSG